MPSNSEWERAKTQYKRDVGKSFLSAILGGYDKNGNPIIDEPLLPGYVYVRYAQANGVLSAPTILPYESTQPKNFGQAVRVGHNRYNQLAVLGANELAQNSAGINTLGNNANDPNVSYYVVQQRITTANSHPISSSTASMLVTIQNWLWIESGVVNYYLGGDGGGGDPIDLTSYIPVTANNHCIACLFIKSDNTVEIIASTEKDNAVNLDITDIQECVTASSAGSKPIWAWQLYEGQTGITPGNVNAGGDDFMDLRQFINVNDSSASFSLTVGDGSTTVTDVTEIDFDGATVTDEGGGVVTVAITGGGTFPTAATLWADQNKVLAGNALLNDIANSISTQAYQTQTYQNPAANADSFKTQPFLLAAGTYTVKFLGILYSNGGICEWYLDSDVTPFLTGQDWYAGSPTYNTIQTGTVTVTDGEHILKCVVTGQHAGSSDYFIPLTKIWLEL